MCVASDGASVVTPAPLPASGGAVAAPAPPRLPAAYSALVDDLLAHTLVMYRWWPHCADHACRCYSENHHPRESDDILSIF